MIKELGGTHALALINSVPRGQEGLVLYGVDKEKERQDIHA